MIERAQGHYQPNMTVGVQPFQPPVASSLFDGLLEPSLYVLAAATLMPFVNSRAQGRISL